MVGKIQKMNNKGQLKIQQMAFVLIAVTILFALAGMFFLAIQLSSLRGNVESLNEKNALLLVSKLANSPEFSCGESFGNQRTNCIDLDKAMVLKEDAFKYAGFWGVNSIQVRKVYPVDEFYDQACTLANYPRCGIIEIKSNSKGGLTASNFVSICRKENVNGDLIDKCELGRVIATYEG